jgi:2-dehydro-3-deoxyglucarate aldolase/4-hydroxy-2-oxoheptanedioate aldolase
MGSNSDEIKSPGAISFLMNRYNDCTASISAQGTTMARRIKELLKTNHIIRAFGMGQLCDPKIIEMVGMQNWWDAVWLDQEHCDLTYEQLAAAARGARAAGLDCFVRVAPTDYATVMRPLEVGALGVMAAQIRNAEQAADIIQWAKFHPIGMRGVNSGGFDGGYGTMTMAEYTAKANDATYVIIQIEHFDAVRCVEKIAALKGLDMLFIGPADLSQSMGILGQWEHPQMTEAIQRVAKACAAANIAWSILPQSPELCKKYVKLGARMLSIGFDMWFIHRGARSFVQDYAWLK